MYISSVCVSNIYIGHTFRKIVLVHCLEVDTSHLLATHAPLFSLFLNLKKIQNNRSRHSRLVDYYTFLYCCLYRHWKFQQLFTTHTDFDNKKYSYTVTHLDKYWKVLLKYILFQVITCILCGVCYVLGSLMAGNQIAI